MRFVRIIGIMWVLCGQRLKRTHIQIMKCKNCFRLQGPPTDRFKPGYYAHRGTSNSMAKG